MKSILKFLISLSLLLGLFACSSLPTEEDSSSSVKSSVQFTMQNIANSANSNILFSSTESETPSKVAISYKKSGEGEEVISTTIELTAFGSSYITDDVLSLYEGNYEVTKFDVLNDEGTTIYSTPVSGSEKAKDLNITTALAYGFEVKEGEISTEKMQVVAVTDTTNPADFGHAAFTFDKVDFSKFYIEVLVLDETGWVYTTAQVDVVNAENTNIKTASLDGKMNKVIVANSDSYKITISKDGYASQEFTFTKAKLEAYEKEAMVVKLKKAETSVLELSDGEDLWAMLINNEGNYVVASTNKIKKVNTSGKVILEKEFPVDFTPIEIIQTKNGDYVVCGAYILRYDSDFNLLWQTSISGYNTFSVIENLNNELVFTELKSDNNYGSAIAKLDASGNLIWNIGINSCNSCFDVIQQNNGNYLVVSNDVLWGSDDDYCAYIVNDSSKETINSVRLTSNGSQEVNYSVTDMGDGYIFTGRADDSYSYLKFVKTDYSLNKLWEKDFTGPVSYCAWYNPSSTKTIDGNLVMLSSYGGILSLLKIDSDGNIIFQKNISNSIFTGNYFNFLKATSDGGFVFCVSKYIFKFDTDGNCPELENL